MRRVTRSLQIKSRPSSGIAPTVLQIPAREAEGPSIGTSRRRTTRLRTSRSRIRFRQISLRTLPLRSRFLPRTYTLPNVKQSFGSRGIHVREPRLHVRILFACPSQLPFYVLCTTSVPPRPRFLQLLLCLYRTMNRVFTRQGHIGLESADRGSTRAAREASRARFCCATASLLLQLGGDPEQVFRFPAYLARL